jgi:hypothetical protein
MGFAELQQQHASAVMQQQKVHATKVHRHASEAQRFVLEACLFKDICDTHARSCSLSRFLSLYIYSLSLSLYIYRERERERERAREKER